MPEISSSSPRALSIAHTPAETKASDPAQQAEIRGGQLQVHADVASDNIHPHERPSPPASSQAASQAAPSSVTAVRPGLKPSAATLATLALPNQASPNNLRAHSAVGFNAFNTRARSPSSRSRDIPNQPPIGSPRTGTFTSSHLDGESKQSVPFDNWDLETKEPPSRQSASTSSTASTLSPSGSPLSHSASSLDLADGYGSGQSSPSMSPIRSVKLPPLQGLARSASAMQLRVMSDLEKMDVILQNPDMRAEAESLLHGLWAREVIPFMNKYDAFVNATTDAGRGSAYAAIYEDHLRDGSEHYINVYDVQVKELKALGPWTGPMPANSPHVGKLQAALVEVKKIMVNALNVQGTANPYHRQAHDLLRRAAQPPAPTKSERMSLSGAVKSWFKRGLIHSSPKRDSPPSSSGNSSSTPISSSSSSSGPRSIASAEAQDYINMDAVLASPGATKDLRAYLRRGLENRPEGVGTESLDFLESYVDIAVAAADPAEQKKLLAAMIEKFVRISSPSAIQFKSIGFRGRVVRASEAWTGDAAMPQALVDDLAEARVYIEQLLQSRGGGLDLLRKELFSEPGPEKAT